MPMAPFLPSLLHLNDPPLMILPTSPSCSASTSAPAAKSLASVNGLARSDSRIGPNSPATHSPAPGKIEKNANIYLMGSQVIESGPESPFGSEETANISPDSISPKPSIIPINAFATSSPSTPLLFEATSSISSPRPSHVTDYNASTVPGSSSSSPSINSSCQVGLNCNFTGATEPFSGHLESQLSEPAGIKRQKAVTCTAEMMLAASVSAATAAAVSNGQQYGQSMMINEFDFSWNFEPKDVGMYI
ncbi:unnamed protein product [Protopolystoma xenopodis]|uniref:Uncharacterized protein n=1 Tax=Protopolystoma xenopodis TaxID=117903 RepID=A0A448WUB2_9PLAT|nr:unnamed protein product [Protopolystoma xenopodis]